MCFRVCAHSPLALGRNLNPNSFVEELPQEDGYDKQNSAAQTEGDKGFSDFFDRHSGAPLKAIKFRFKEVIGRQNDN
jgi:hypothetical protein